MPDIYTHTPFLRKFDIQICAALISILLSVAVLFTQTPINPDGILYLRAAETFLQQGFTAAMQVYNWPFYYFLIAWLSKFTHLSLLSAAHLLNTALIATIAVTYIALLKELGGTRAIQYWGAMVILIFPVLNHERAMIIRDFGYWACSLWALLQLLRFVKNSHWRFAFGWGITMALATTFRIEGIIFWALGPCALLFITSQNFLQRLLLFLKANSILGIGILLALIGLITHPSMSSEKLGRLPELAFWLLHSGQSIVDTMQTKATLLSQTILSPYAANNATIILVGGTISVLLWTILITLHPLYAFCAFHAAKKKLFVTSQSHKIILITFIVINLMVLSLFIASRQFLDGRYVMALCFLLLLWVPFSLHHLFLRWRSLPVTSKKNWLFPGICLVMIFMAFNSVIRFGQSKAYILEASHWIEQQTPSNALLYTNSQQIAFYAHRPGTDWKNDFILEKPFFRIQDSSWKHYNYLALQISHKQPAIEQQIEQQLTLKPIQTFQNKRGDKILIFKVQHE